MKSDFRSESCKRKFKLAPLIVYNLMIECSKKNWENDPKTAYEQRNVETWI